MALDVPWNIYPLVEILSDEWNNNSAQLIATRLDFVLAKRLIKSNETSIILFEAHFHMQRENENEQKKF